MPVLLNQSKPDLNVLLCPFTNYSFHNGLESGEDINQTLKFLKLGYPNVYRFDFERLVKELSGLKYPVKKDFVLVHGDNDQSIPADELYWLIKKYKIDKNKIFQFTGGHSASLPTAVWKHIIAKLRVTNK